VKAEKVPNDRTSTPCRQVISAGVQPSVASAFAKRALGRVQVAVSW
jgi:hypothetical protein